MNFKKYNVVVSLMWHEASTFLVQQETLKPPASTAFTKDKTQGCFFDLEYGIPSERTKSPASGTAVGNLDLNVGPLSQMKPGVMQAQGMVMLLSLLLLLLLLSLWAKVQGPHAFPERVT